MIENIKKEYQQHEAKLLSEGRLMRETCLGYYGPASVSSVSDLFRKIGVKGSFVDLGSGDGRVVLVAALFADAEGIEADKELVDESKRICSKLGIKAGFVQGDYLDACLSGYDFLFLNPDSRFPELEKKLRNEMKQGAKLIVMGSLYRPLNMKEEKSIVIDGTRFGIYRKS
ncbi:MAG: hypothetical protein R6U32_00195 [Candidatus Woesearchaeota archaeon]